MGSVGKSAVKQALHGLCAMFIWGDSITALLVISWNSLPGFVLKKSCCHFFPSFFPHIHLADWMEEQRTTRLSACTSPLLHSCQCQLEVACRTLFFC